MTADRDAIAERGPLTRLGTGASPAVRRLPLGLADRRAILVWGDVVLLLALTAMAVRLGAERSGWALTPDFWANRAGWFLLLPSLWMGLAWAVGLYDLRRAPERFAAIVLGAKVSLQVLLIWAVAYFVPPPWTLVRHVVVFFTAGTAVVMPAWRLLYASVFSRGELRQRVLIVGAGRAGRLIRQALADAAPHVYEVVGFADDDGGLAQSKVDGVPVVCSLADLAAGARDLGATNIVLAISHDLPGHLLAALLKVREQGLTVQSMPVLYERLTGRVPVEHVGDHWEVALPLDVPAERGLYGLVRRGLDVMAALAGLGALALVLPFAWPLIRLGSPGPGFYRQTRVGRGGRPFTLLKLRTMVEDAEPSGPAWAQPADPRVTGIGRWLRRARLDELPQVVNILAGEMSLIGPRPERPEFEAELERVIPFYSARHAVRPGLTGWATIHQGYTSSTQDALIKLQYDLYYIKHQSLALDAYILVKTVGTVLRLGGR